MPLAPLAVQNPIRTAVTDRRLGPPGPFGPAACLSSVAGWMHPRWPRTAREGVSPPTRPPSYPQNKRSVIARSHHEGGPLTTSLNRPPADRWDPHRGLADVQSPDCRGAWGSCSAHRLTGNQEMPAGPDSARVHLAKTKNALGARSGASDNGDLVPHIGFEPMISALRGL